MFLAIMALRVVVWKEEVQWGKVHSSWERQLDGVLCFFNILFLLTTIGLCKGISQA